MWENHKSQCHLKGHILRIHAHFSKLENIDSKKAVKMCQNYFVFCFEPI